MATQTWQLDTTHTSIGFTVRHMVVAKVHGRFTRFEGKLLVPDSDFTRAETEVTIDAASIDTQVEGRDGHLRSADFFDVEKFPTIRFRSMGVQAAGKDQYRIDGELTIRGVTRPVALKAEFLGAMKDPFGQDRVAFTATAQLDRKDFGLTWNKALETGGVLVADRIDLQLEVQATPAVAAPAVQAA